MTRLQGDNANKPFWFIADLSDLHQELGIAAPNGGTEGTHCVLLIESESYVDADNKQAAMVRCILDAGFARNPKTLCQQKALQGCRRRNIQINDFMGCGIEMNWALLDNNIICARTNSPTNV